MNFAFVFPGQGSQYVGMGQALAASSSAAGAVWQEADAALAEPISTLAFDGPDDALNLTVNSQPAILACSIAYLRALEERLSGPGAEAALTPDFFAGHSMGQYSAMVAAGVISLADGVRLVRERGKQMQASAEDGSMAAVIGLPDEALAALESAGQSLGVFIIANRNSPGQIVVSGERAAVEGAAEKAKELGAKRAIVLPVSVAAHSPLMSRAADAMREVLASVQFNDPSAPLLANADARLLTTADECRAELVEHLTRGVDWIKAVETMSARGVGRFVEVGPGKVLTGLIKRISPESEAIAVDEQSTADRFAIPDFLSLSSPTGATS
ncbi:MAG: [acyl-carrier-protein] S-malonyltransferase [Chloroflexota bacterium]|nr:[acyl-carrier-protein] S-malonyltransferase [Chloroflexota bacterium]